MQSVRLEKFTALLNSTNISLTELQQSSWHGIPQPVRATTWRLLSVSCELEKILLSNCEAKLKSRNEII